MRRTLLPLLLILGTLSVVPTAAVTADSASLAALPVRSAPTPAESWQPAGEVDGVPVESRPTETGFDVHRAQVHVCTDLSSLEDFVVDASGFDQWVAFTRSARLLEQTDESAVYYVLSSTPWPLKDRDMVYRISRVATTSEGLRLTLTGLPDYAPPTKEATRIRSAAGEWRLVPGEAGIDVSYELFVDPGRVPRFVANQRLATAVGQTLANLVARFPCEQS